MGDNLFEIVIMGGGMIGYVILALSVIMVGLGIKLLVDIRRDTIMPDMARDKLRELFEAGSYRDAVVLTGEEPSYFSRITHAALSVAGQGYAAMERALEETAEERTTRMLRSIEWLNLIGNIGPMLGLLGTVWGMIMAFDEIAKASAMPEPGQLAEAIGIALVTTLQGLAVAIPSLGMYGFLRNRIDALTSEAMVASTQLISGFRFVSKAEHEAQKGPADKPAQVASHQPQSNS